MNNIKNINDFKLAMTVGTTWECTHRYIDLPKLPVKSLGIRKCGLSNTVNFGFTTDNGSISRCRWPNKKQFSTEDNGNVVVITTSFCILKYIEMI